MQIDSLKDSTKVLELGLKDTGKEIKEPESANEKISLGEAFNKNIRTKVMTYGDTVNKLREEDRAVSKFKEQAEKATKTLEYNAKMLSPEIMKGLEEKGVSATDSDADLVKKSVENIVQNREISREYLEKQAEKLSEETENIKELSYGNTEDGRLAKLLEKSGMAVTKENIEKLSTAVDFVKDVIKNINEPAISHMIEADLPETISNIYRAEHTESYREVSQTVEKEETWFKIENQAVNLLESKGVTADEDSLGAAKWLFTKGMEITPASVAKYLSLNELRNGAGTTEGIGKLADRLAKGISEGREATEAIVGTAN